MKHVVAKSIMSLPAYYNKAIFPLIAKPVNDTGMEYANYNWRDKAGANQAITCCMFNCNNISACIKSASA